MNKMPEKICSHFKTNGERCEAIALTDQSLCYFHSRARQRELVIDRGHAARLRRIASGKSATEYYKSIHSQELFDESSASLFNALELPVLEDAAAIQITVTSVLRALATQQIDRRIAAFML